MNMRLCSLEKAGNTFLIWIDDGEHYISYTIGKEEITQEQRFKKSDYSNYEHFAGVMGKFNPYTRFLIKPIKIEQLAYGELEKAKKKMPQKKRK